MSRTGYLPNEIAVGSCARLRTAIGEIELQNQEGFLHRVDGRSKSDNNSHKQRNGAQRRAVAARVSVLLMKGGGESHESQRRGRQYSE